MSQIITRENLSTLVDALIVEGTSVIAPVAVSSGRFFFQPLVSAEKLVLDPGVMPTNSVKEFVFPRHETLCCYRHEGKELILLDADPFTTRQVIFGPRPCDAAALPILDKIFAWDFQDRFYQQRREKTTVVSLACKEADKNCFCTSVGLSPDTQSGADAMLLDLGDGSLEVRVFTEKGKVLFDGKTTDSDKTGQTAAPPPVRFDAAKVMKHLAEHFDDPVFEVTGLRCVGCGACTYVCPTCHCFDIVDEGGPTQGKRVKNWDSCQMTQFTHHASGHNPRGTQAMRQRNRIQHKFCIYPEKFGVILCTGCGNCSRECCATLGIRPVLELIDKKASEGTGNRDQEQGK